LLGKESFSGAVTGDGIKLCRLTMPKKGRKRGMGSLIKSSKLLIRNC
jgi:hypothetical protein